MVDSSVHKVPQLKIVKKNQGRVYTQDNNYQRVTNDNGIGLQSLRQNEIHHCAKSQQAYQSGFSMQSEIL